MDLHTSSFLTIFGQCINVLNYNAGYTNDRLERLVPKVGASLPKVSGRAKYGYGKGIKKTLEEWRQGSKRVLLYAGPIQEGFTRSVCLLFKHALLTSIKVIGLSPPECFFCGEPPSTSLLARFASSFLTCGKKKT